MRRLTESQYRNSIADIFGPDVQVAGRFEPIVRPQHQLIATGASASAISPAGLEQFDALARNIARQVFAPERRATFVPCTPANAAAPDDACARATLTPIARLLFRRSITQKEADTLVTRAASAARVSGSFYTGLELTLASMLVAPDFLYVIESAEPDPEHPGDMRLDAASRASRLSFLLWNTTPDRALLNAADAGQLADPATLRAFASQMISSPRFRDGVGAFFADMLLFEKFDEIAKDSIIYPRFNPDVARALPEQMLRTIVDQVVTRDGDYRDLFTTRRTFMTRALGPIYQVRVKARDGWEPYEFDAHSDRAGLLSLAGFLALYSHSGRSSPTLRGRAIRELLMCQPVPNPPGNVNFTAVQDTTNKAMPTARVRLEAHTSDAVCAGCHKITDPIGLPLERFDGIGAFRDRENDAPIDISGSFNGKDLLGASGLGQSLAQDPASTSCVASRALEYTVGRNIDGDSRLLETIERNFTDSGYRIQALFLAAATAPEAYRVSPVARPVIALASMQSTGGH
jgi:hypothetical protein